MDSPEPVRTSNTPSDRRHSPVKGGDTVRGALDRSAHGEVDIVADKDIIYQYLISKTKENIKVFKSGLLPGRVISVEIGKTKDGKHVLLQQGARACAVTAVAMLVLDLEKTPPDFSTGKMVSDDQVVKWVEKSGLKPICSEKLSKELLVERIKKYGPGILGISHPDAKGHDVILDAIDLLKKTATIRDPYHGWMITMKLAPLMSWVNKHSCFIQIES